METWQRPVEVPLKGVKRCMQTDCDAGLHCFLKHRAKRAAAGACHGCGAVLVDWDRLHQRNIEDVEHTVGALNLEYIRHEFWCTVPLTEKAKNYAVRRGRLALGEAAHTRLRGCIAKAADAFDGRRTPFEDRADVLHYGQHATATCCRKCLEVWHGIPRERTLSDSELQYFTGLLLRFVDVRMPDLAPERVHVPPRRAGRPHEAA